MLGFDNQYLKKICFPCELGYFGSLAFVYKFPNGITLHLIDTCKKGSPYCFVYALYNEDGQLISIRDKLVFYHYAPSVPAVHKISEVPDAYTQMDEFFNRISKLGTDEPIEISPIDYINDYRLENHGNLFYP